MQSYRNRSATFAFYIHILVHLCIGIKSVRLARVSLLVGFSRPDSLFVSMGPISCHQHHIIMPKLMTLNSVMELLSDDSDDERFSEGWFHEMESSRAYKDAVLVFLTRKFCRH